MPHSLSQTPAPGSLDSWPQAVPGHLPLGVLWGRGQGLGSGGGTDRATAVSCTGSYVQAKQGTGSNHKGKT